MITKAWVAFLQKSSGLAPPRQPAQFDGLGDNGPMETPTLTLYTRSDCPLCEEAQSLLNELGHRYHTQDIDLDLGLLKRYGTRIPVLVDAQTQTEWDWPFSADTLQAMSPSTPQSE